MQKNGIYVMSGFAALWCVGGLSALPNVKLQIFAIPLIVSAALIAYARRLPGHADKAARRKVARVIGWASIGEFGAIFAANAALGAAGQGEYAVCATAGIVGLHFLPLAHFLRVRRYYATGAALVTLAAASCAIVDAQTRLLAVGLGAALLLWITCLSSFACPRQEGIAAA